jgi:hypothetical protein
MNTKEMLVENIKKWLECDKRISDLQKEMKEIKKTKKKLTDDLTEAMKHNSTEAITTNHGEIRYTKSEVKQGINKKYLDSVLTKYYTNPVMAKEICDFIMDNREVKVKENIRLKKDKN